MTSKAKRKKEKNDKQNNDDRGQKIKKKIIFYLLRNTVSIKGGHILFFSI